MLGKKWNRRELLWFSGLSLLCHGAKSFGKHAEEQKAVHLLAGGDFCLGMRSLESIIEREGMPFLLHHLASTLQQADYILVNLECPVTEHTIQVKKEFTFKMKPSYLAYGEEFPFLFSLANNHIGDYGRKGMLDTFAALEAYGIPYCGAGRNLEEALQGCVVEKHGIKLGFLAYSLTIPTEFYAGKDKPGTLPATPSIVEEGIRRLRPMVDALVVSFHWGTQHSHYPTMIQQNMAHLAADAGADIILGHHPHVLQGIELYGGKVSAYSLGNFLFRLGREKESMLLEFEVQKEGITEVTIIPLITDIAQPRIATGTDAERIYQHLSEYSRIFPHTLPPLGSAATPATRSSPSFPAALPSAIIH